jgi:hypothetical protein
MMKTIIFDEDGPRHLGNQSPEQLHATVAAAVGEPFRYRSLT